MAAVFAFSRNAAKKFCKNTSFSKLFLFRSRRYSGDGRVQHRKRLGKRELHPGRPEDESKFKMIVRPLGFTVMTGAVSFGACSILQYEKVRGSYIHKNQAYFPSTGSKKQFGIRDMFNKWWNSLPDGSKTASVIIFLNTTVFLLWKIPQMQNFMWKWFTMSPGPGSSVRLLTSAFSHMDFWHLGVNMFVLWSFAPHVEALLGKEQFIAFYLTGGTVTATSGKKELWDREENAQYRLEADTHGLDEVSKNLLKCVFASFASTAYKVIVTSSALGASLGASGALLAVLSLWCIHEPDTRLAIVFLPFLTFSAGTGLVAIAGFDLAGLIFRWQFFDHAAHLGGVLFGGLYLKYGHHYLWEKRSWLISHWHKLRAGNKRS